MLEIIIFKVLRASGLIKEISTNSLRKKEFVLISFIKPDARKTFKRMLCKFPFTLMKAFSCVKSLTFTARFQSLEVLLAFILQSRILFSR